MSCIEHPKRYKNHQTVLQNSRKCNRYISYDSDDQKWPMIVCAAPSYPWLDRGRLCSETAEIKT